MDWIRRVHEDADFEAILEKVTFDEGRAFAFLLDGFEVAGGIHSSYAIALRVVADVGRFNRPDASALDLWVSLHFWHKAHIRGDLPPSDEDEVMNQRLVGHLRVALNRMNGRQRAGIMGILRDEQTVSR